MIQPTIRCAQPQCGCQVSMAKALRVGTRLYCSFHCAYGHSECGSPPSAARVTQGETSAGHHPG